MSNKTYVFYVKKNVDLTKYGFVDDNTRWTISTSVIKLDINKRTMRLTFNQPTSNELRVFAEMVKDDIIIIKDRVDKPLGTHYIGLNDEEYELIKQFRLEHYDNNY